LVSLQLGLDASMAANGRAPFVCQQKKKHNKKTKKSREITASEQNVFLQSSRKPSVLQKIQKKNQQQKRKRMKSTENGKMCVASGSHCLMAVRWNVRHKLKSYCVARPAVRPATPPPSLAAPLPRPLLPFFLVQLSRQAVFALKLLN